ncbi:hypothetical protein T552_02570 [Pneumocystis carinii B80]|uniref:Uncharacterized protein n=1 Tax=Pneumocystis carinii (strain B80) TaxID=1408658 RepID=A0A0W4ZFE7_PNEC8|nr:hypothetical protein T552_02570 [Pneumocystis carinii B80]KTW27078.1 hypothetical protein T552_02570 [Pneumocystis carinii B80]
MTSVFILDVPPGSTFGIDGHSWITGHRFCGIRGLSNGLHWAYYNISGVKKDYVNKIENTQLKGLESFSQGFFFYVDSLVLIFRYDHYKEMILGVEDVSVSEMGMIEPWLISFPRENGLLQGYDQDRINKTQDVRYIDDEYCFYHLIAWVTRNMLNCLLPSGWHVSSITSSDLDEVLPNLPVIETEPEMVFLPINSRCTWKPGALGREITEGFLDKSWELERILQNVCLGDSGRFLGEFQLCFIIFLFVSNGSCLEQWMKMLTLVSSCCRAISVFPDFYVNWIDILKIQLLYCPDEIYQDIFQECNFLKISLKNLRRNLFDAQVGSASIGAVKDAFTQLSLAVKQKFCLNIETQPDVSIRSSLVYGMKNDELFDTSESNSMADDSDDDPVVVFL